MRKIIAIALLSTIALAGQADAGKLSGQVASQPTSVKGTSSQHPIGFNFPGYCNAASTFHKNHHGLPDQNPFHPRCAAQ